LRRFKKSPNCEDRSIPPHLVGQTILGCHCGLEAHLTTAFRLSRNPRENARLAVPWIRHSFAAEAALLNVDKYFRLHTFAHRWELPCVLALTGKNPSHTIHLRSLLRR
jgi:hypothetical protein